VYLVNEGNGTEDIVRRYRDASRILLFSLHIFDKDEDAQAEFFPGTGAADDNVTLLSMQ
jgi:acetoin utilization deacetylase AcuC-like enzyme